MEIEIPLFNWDFEVDSSTCENCDIPLKAIYTDGWTYYCKQCMEEEKKAKIETALQLERYVDETDKKITLFSERILI